MKHTNIAILDLYNQYIQRQTDITKSYINSMSIILTNTKIQDVGDVVALWGGTVSMTVGTYQQYWISALNFFNHRVPQDTQ